MIGHLMGQWRTILLFAVLSAPAMALAAVGKNAESDRALLVAILLSEGLLAKRMTAVEKFIAAEKAKK